MRITNRYFNHQSATIFLIFILTISIVACKDYSDSAANATMTTEREKVKEIGGFYKQGKYLFNENCHSCHRNPDGSERHEMVFEGLFDRMPEPADDYFIKYVSDSKALESAGDKYALALKENWGGIGKHDFKDKFSKDDFKALILYMRISLDIRRNRYTKETH